MARLQIHTSLPDVSLNVCIPEYAHSPARRKGISEKDYYADRSLPVLWLLHGAMGNSEDWFRYTRIELYAEEKGIIVVCPTTNNGIWVNHKVGPQWEDVLTEKLWEFVHSNFPTSDKVEDNYIAGLSMGGYGSLRIGLLHPERYSRIGSFSSGVCIPQQYAAGKFNFPGINAERIFGPADEILGSDYDGYAVAERRAASDAPRPSIYMCCGRDDWRLKECSEYRDHLRNLGFEVAWEELDGYDHEWRFWDLEVEKFIKSLPDKY